MRPRRIIERVTGSPEETEGLGRRLGVTARGGELLALLGDLGAGKTCLVRGFAEGLGIDPAEVASPTFVLATEYRGGRLPLRHVDLYRLDEAALEAAAEDRLLIAETLDCAGVVAVEWYDRLDQGGDAEGLMVTLRHGDGDRRYIRFDARGARHVRWLVEALDR